MGSHQPRLTLSTRTIPVFEFDLQFGSIFLHTCQISCPYLRDNGCNEILLIQRNKQTYKQQLKYLQPHYFAGPVHPDCYWSAQVRHQRTTNMEQSASRS